MAEQIYFKVKDQDFGPFESVEFEELIAQGKVPLASWVFFEQQWVWLSQHQPWLKIHPDFSAKPQQKPSEKTSSKKAPKLEPVQASVSRSDAILSTDAVWFVVRNKKKYGPYSASEIVQQVQKKELDTSAFVWRPGFQTWQKLSKVKEFSRENLKALATGGAGATSVDVFFKRKFVRAPYEVEIIAHDNNKVIEGRSMVIGEGGLFLSTDRPLHAVGARLKLHFREGDTPAFNAIAEVVSVVKGDDAGYSMRFVALSDADRKHIAKLVTEKTKKVKGA